MTQVFWPRHMVGWHAAELADLCPELPELYSSARLHQVSATSLHLLLVAKGFGALTVLNLKQRDTDP